MHIPNLFEMEFFNESSLEIDSVVYTIEKRIKNLVFMFLVLIKSMSFFVEINTKNPYMIFMLCLIHLMRPQKPFTHLYLF